MNSLSPHPVSDCPAPSMKSRGYGRGSSPVGRTKTPLQFNAFCKGAGEIRPVEPIGLFGAIPAPGRPDSTLTIGGARHD